MSTGTGTRPPVPFEPPVTTPGGASIEYESRSGNQTGYARDMVDENGNRTREAGGTTGPVDNPRTETQVSIEETRSGNTNTASWSGRAGSETVTAPERD